MNFADIDDIVAACILSSYVPAITGPAWGSLAVTNQAVKRAQARVHDMLELGYVKRGDTGHAVVAQERLDREVYWDGGLVNVWPIVDDETVIVTPICARFSPNPYISPAMEHQCDSSKWDWIMPPTIRVNSTAEIHLNYASMTTFRQMLLSSDETVLQQRFSQGYDNAMRFLQENNLLTVYSSTGVTSSDELAVQ